MKIVILLYDFNTLKYYNSYLQLKEDNMNIKKTLFITIGIISLIIGTITAFIPLIPSFPFLLLTTILFARSSEKFHCWFLETKLYKNNLETYLKKQGMSLNAKIRVISIISISISIGLYFVIINQFFVLAIILFIVWISHILYFIFFVETIK